MKTAYLSLFRGQALRAASFLFLYVVYLQLIAYLPSLRVQALSSCQLIAYLPSLRVLALSSCQLIAYLPSIRVQALSSCAS